MPGTSAKLRLFCQIKSFDFYFFFLCCLTAGKYAVLTALFHSLNVLCNPDSKAVTVFLVFVKSDAILKTDTKDYNVD